MAQRAWKGTQPSSSAPGPLLSSHPTLPPAGQRGNLQLRIKPCPGTSGGPVVKNPPANAGGAGSIPDL